MNTEYPRICYYCWEEFPYVDVEFDIDYDGKEVASCTTKECEDERDEV